MESALLMKLLGGAGTTAASANPAAGILTAIPELFKAGVGIQDLIQGKKISKNLVRPDMAMSQGLNEATDIARMNAMDTRLPGQDIIQEQLARNLATSVGGIMNSGGGSSERMAAMVGANQAGADALTNLGVNAAQMQQQDMMALANQLNRVGLKQDEMWDWNKRQKYVSAAEKAEALKDSGVKNIYSAAKGLGGAAMMGISPPSGMGSSSGVGAGMSGVGGAVNKAGLASGVQFIPEDVTKASPIDLNSFYPQYTPLPTTPPIENLGARKKGFLNQY